MPKTIKIFISYSHQDSAFARRLAVDLRKRGYVVWFDEGEIQIGESLIEKICDGIDRVDFIAAVLSKDSIQSEWVKKELDYAMNREIAEKRVIVLPLLIDDIKPPYFLKGKRYADFRNKSTYEDTLNEFTSALGPGHPAPEFTKDQLKDIEEELEFLRKKLALFTKIDLRRQKLMTQKRSPRLEAAIKEDNKQYPEYSLINESYAFEVMDSPITLGYALHAIRKASIKGTRVLEVMLTIEDKWSEFYGMIEAYADYIGIEHPNFEKES